jgi:hypothetical protein
LIWVTALAVGVPESGDIAHGKVFPEPNLTCSHLYNQRAVLLVSTLVQLQSILRGCLYLPWLLYPALFCREPLVWVSFASLPSHSVFHRSTIFFLIHVSNVVLSCWRPLLAGGGDWPCGRFAPAAICAGIHEIVISMIGEGSQKHFYELRSEVVPQDSTSAETPCLSSATILCLRQKAIPGIQSPLVNSGSQSWLIPDLGDHFKVTSRYAD